jgi:hypothetical protein
MKRSAMALHIAAPFPTCFPAFGGSGGEHLQGSAANDNRPASLQDSTVRAALRHFGKYGFGAAHEARRLSEVALRGGEKETSRHWFEIHRMLGDGGSPFRHPHLASAD